MTARLSSVRRTCTRS